MSLKVRQILSFCLMGGIVLGLMGLMVIKPKPGIYIAKKEINYSKGITRKRIDFSKPTRQPANNKLHPTRARQLEKRVRKRTVLVSTATAEHTNSV